MCHRSIGECQLQDSETYEELYGSLHRWRALCSDVSWAWQSAHESNFLLAVLHGDATPKRNLGVVTLDSGIVFQTVIASYRIRAASASFEVALFWLLSYSYSMKWYSYSYSKVPDQVRVPLSLSTSTKKLGKTSIGAPRSSNIATSKSASDRL